jgi:hypothetical protein
VRLAAALGFVVAIDDRQACRGRHVRLPGGDCHAAAILLRPEPRGERRQWAVAHEIGEHVAHDVYRRLGLDADDVAPGERERTANALASRLLLPSDWFHRDGRACRWDLPRLKRRYATASYELIARRALDDYEPAIVTIFDHGRVSFRRGNFRGGLPGLSALEKEVCDHAAAAGTTQQRRELGFLVRAWPIHEPGWNREIVRTEPLEAADFA